MMFVLFDTCVPLPFQIREKASPMNALEASGHPVNYYWCYYSGIAICLYTFYSLLASPICTARRYVAGHERNEMKRDATHRTAPPKWTSPKQTRRHGKNRTDVKRVAAKQNDGTPQEGH